MPKVNVSVPHSLGQAEAAKRLGGFMEEIKRKYAGQIKIVEEEFGETSGKFAFKTAGLTISGDVEVSESDVAVDCNLPFAAMMFKGRVQKEIRDSLAKVLG